MQYTIFDTEFVHVGHVYLVSNMWLVIATLGHLVLDEVDIQVIIFSSNPGEYWLHEPDQGCKWSIFQNPSIVVCQNENCGQIWICLTISNRRKGNTPGNLVHVVCTGTFPQNWSLSLPNHQNVLRGKAFRFSKAFATLTFRPFGVSTPTRPYWILLLWKLVTKLSMSPWVKPKIYNHLSY